MALDALLFSRDQEIIDLADEVLKTLDIEVADLDAAQTQIPRVATVAGSRAVAMT